MMQPHGVLDDLGRESEATIRLDDAVMRQSCHASPDGANLTKPLILLAAIVINLYAERLRTTRTVTTLD